MPSRSSVLLLKKEIIIDCSGTVTKPWREKMRSTFFRAGVEKPPVFSTLCLQAALSTSSCVCSVETHPSRVIHLHPVSEELMGKRGQAVRAMKRNSYPQMELHSCVFHLPSNTWVFQHSFRSQCWWCSLRAHLYPLFSPPFHPLHHVALPNLISVHQIQNTSAQEYQTCAE